MGERRMTTLGTRHTERREAYDLPSDVVYAKNFSARVEEQLAKSPAIAAFQVQRHHERIQKGSSAVRDAYAPGIQALCHAVLTHARSLPESFRNDHELVQLNSGWIYLAHRLAEACEKTPWAEAANFGRGEYGFN